MMRRCSHPLTITLLQRFWDARRRRSVIVARFSDLMLWETAPVAMTFEASYADSMGILARLHIYLACLPQRQPKAISIITGTGLVDPVY